MNEQRIRKLSELRSTIDILLDLLSANGLSPSTADQFRSITEQQFKLGSIRGLKSIRGDLTEPLLGLPSAAKEQLSARLTAAGFSYPFDEQLDAATMVTAVIRRGSILTEAEYRAVESRVEEIFQDDDKADELEKLNNLLRTYE